MLENRFFLDIVFDKFIPPEIPSENLMILGGNRSSLICLILEAQFGEDLSVHN